MTSIDHCAAMQPAMDGRSASDALDAAPGPFLAVRNLHKTFVKDGVAKKAVDGVSFDLHAGRCLGLVGESGSGKSTVARMVTRFLSCDEGVLLLSGREYTRAAGRGLSALYRQIQLVFQDPAASFDPRMTLGASVSEPLRKRGLTRSEARERARGLFDECGLGPSLLDSYPHEVSGGQCQRAAIARALASEPRFLVCDEATSALDVTVQRRIVELLKRVQVEHGMALLFISHDIALVGELCDHIAVMRDGRIVEQGTVERIFSDPQDPYTKELLDAVL